VDHASWALQWLWVSSWLGQVTQTAEQPRSIDTGRGSISVEAQKTVVVMPAYNAAKTLQSTLERIPPGIADRIIVVDDGSHDGTAELAASLDLVVIAHPHNAGYGANQKTCYMEALREGADVVVMLHPDGQYDPAILGDMVEVIRSGRAEVVLGSRFLTTGGPQAGGMPLWKRLSNRFLTFCENVVLRLGLSEYHTGYRAYSRNFLTTVPFLRNSNDFVFDTQILTQAASFKFKVAEIPVTTRYFADASSVNFRVSLVYGLKTVWTLVRYQLHRMGLHSRRYSP
jgi:glycosyltransferase involved in cell wall biosynthesis